MAVAMVLRGLGQRRLPCLHGMGHHVRVWPPVGRPTRRSHALGAAVLVAAILTTTPVIPNSCGRATRTSRCPHR